MAETPLPPYAYIPGQTPRHPPGRFDALRAQALDPTGSLTAGDNRAFQAGLDFLEAGFYWEAHEVLEPVWRNAGANAPERLLVQGLIQLANAALKHRMGRPRAALRLLAICTDLVRRAGPDAPFVMGLNLAAVRRAVEALRTAVRDGEEVRIRVRSDHRGERRLDRGCAEDQ